MGCVLEHILMAGTLGVCGMVRGADWQGGVGSEGDAGGSPSINFLFIFCDIYHKYFFWFGRPIFIRPTEPIFAPLLQFGDNRFTRLFCGKIGDPFFGGASFQIPSPARSGLFDRDFAEDIADAFFIHI